MIVSVVNEAEWAAALNRLPVWNPPEAPMLVLAPHPDDETLGAGGLIKAQRLRGLDVSIAAVTDGEKAYADTEGLAAVRRVEQTEAVARLGVKSEKIVRFGLPDGSVASREQELVERLAALVSQDTHLVAPWKGDFHADHEACGRAAEQVAYLTGARLTSYFFWTWHFGTVPLIAALSLRRFLLTPELLAAKTAALACHRSQLIREAGDPVLPESLLGPARRSFEVFVAR
jgi:LmbE family N-acetylglucosaminyl deacetylase